MLGTLLQSIGAQVSGGGITLGEGVLLALVTSLVAAGAAWGLWRGKVDALERRVLAVETAAERTSEEGKRMTERVHHVETDVGALRPRIDAVGANADRIAGEVAAGEARLATLISEKFDALRRELRASGTLRGDG